MEPKDQIKTILNIFADLDHEAQVALFKEVKAGLLCIRGGLIEKHQKDQEFAGSNINRLRAGDEEILGANATPSFKQGY